MFYTQKLKKKRKNKHRLHQTQHTKAELDTFSGSLDLDMFSAPPKVSYIQDRTKKKPKQKAKEM
jgi:hypothetical protein